MLDMHVKKLGRGCSMSILLKEEDLSRKFVNTIPCPYTVTQLLYEWADS
jgi:hypothetical protein